jgi:hypothetical protein
MISVSPSFTTPIRSTATASLRQVNASGLSVNPMRFAAKGSPAEATGEKEGKEKPQNCFLQILNGLVNLILAPFRLLGSLLGSVAQAIYGEALQNVAPQSFYQERLGQLATTHPAFKKNVDNLFQERTLPTHGDEKVLDKLATYMAKVDLFAATYTPSGEPEHISESKMKFRKVAREALRDFKSENPKAQYKAAAFLLSEFMQHQLPFHYQPYFQEVYRKNDLTADQVQFKPFIASNERHEIEDIKGIWLKTPKYYNERLEKLADGDPDFLGDIRGRHDDAIRMVAMLMAEAGHDIATKRLNLDEDEELDLSDKQTVDALEEFSTGSKAEQMGAAEHFAEIIQHNPDLKHELIDKVLNATNNQYFHKDY